MFHFLHVSLSSLFLYFSFSVKHISSVSLSLLKQLPLSLSIKTTRPTKKENLKKTHFFPLNLMNQKLVPTVIDQASIKIQAKLSISEYETRKKMKQSYESVISQSKMRREKDEDYL